VQFGGIICYAQEAIRTFMAKVTTYPGRLALDTVGDRMEAIRIAIGGSIRNQISQEALGELVGFDKYKISRIERGAQELSRAEAIAIAAVDPLNRGPAWLMFGSEGGEGQQGATRPTNGPPKRSGPAEWAGGRICSWSSRTNRRCFRSHASDVAVFTVAEFVVCCDRPCQRRSRACVSLTLPLMLSQGCGGGKGNMRSSAGQ